MAPTNSRALSRNADRIVPMVSLFLYLPASFKALVLHPAIKTAVWKELAPIIYV